MLTSTQTISSTVFATKSSKLRLSVKNFQKRFAKQGSPVIPALKDIHLNPATDIVDPGTGVLILNDKVSAESKYPEHLPIWDPNEAYEPYSDDLNKCHINRAYFADPQLKRFFSENGERYQVKKDQK